MTMETKKLYKNRQNRMFSGVCSGIADYFGADPTIIRLITVLIAIFSTGWPVLIGYIICAAIIPDGPA